MDIAMAEATYWNEKEIYANEARSLNEAINYGLDVDYTDSYALGDLIDCLKKIDDIDVSTRQDLANMLPKLENEYRFEREEIENIIK